LRGASHAKGTIAELDFIDLDLLKQPSLLAPAGGGIAPEEVPFFDPLAQHRSWCPWVGVGAGKQLKEALRRGGAATTAAAGGLGGAGLGGAVLEGSAAAAVMSGEGPGGGGGSSSMGMGLGGMAAAGRSGDEVPGWMMLAVALQGDDMVKRAAARAAGQGGDMPSSADVLQRTKELLGLLRDV
jgi:hypothetical protein